MKPKPAKKTSAGERIQRACMKLFWIGCAVAAILVVALATTLGPEATMRGIQAAKPYLAIWRATVFVVLIGGWKFWIDIAWTRTDMNARMYRFLLKQRWRFAAWLLIFEVAIVQEVVVTFIGNLAGLNP